MASTKYGKFFVHLSQEDILCSHLEQAVIINKYHVSNFLSDFCQFDQNICKHNAM